MSQLMPFELASKTLTWTLINSDIIKTSFYNCLSLKSLLVIVALNCRYEREGVVCPSQLRRGLFTTSAVDNIDHNTSATTSQTSFHGTAISLVQHPSTINKGIPRATDTFDPTTSSTTKTISHLPSSYSEVPPMTKLNSDLHAPLVSEQSLACPALHEASLIDEEKEWLTSTQKLISKDKLDPKDWVSWAAYKASQSVLSSYQPAIITLLPMFIENAHSMAMIAHSMRVIKAAVEHVNPSQAPVIALDQPLFALAKQIQWTLPEFSEDKFVVMMGGLHIEMASFKMLGKWLSGSGWPEVMCNAGVATQGVAESFLFASHVARTRRAHQVTAASLYILMDKAYSDYKSSLLEESEHSNILSFDDWKDARAKSPHFHYWALVLDLELICLRLVRAFREADFTRYVDTIRKILPWMFAMDHPNYARWLSVHYRDMCLLPSKHPDIYNHFCDGAFVVHKTTRVFSSIALDHAHEQVNAEVKGEGGAVGLTEHPAALRRWMVAGPEISRMIHEFEGSMSSAEQRDHHEQKPGVQSAFSRDVVNTVSCLEEFGNPFLDESENLMAIHTKDIMGDQVVKTVRNASKIGEEQFRSFFKGRFIDGKPVTDTLKKNNLPTLSTPIKKAVSKDKAKVKVLKEDCSLFSRLYIACQNRDGNLEDFFTYENQPWPPSLSELGQLRGGVKADLLKCLPYTTPQSPAQPAVDAVILDGAVIVQMLEPRTARTFDEYSTTVFAPYVLKHLETAKRVDLVWDVYQDDSLKKSLREKRGAGQRRKVVDSTRIPRDWKGFLRVDENKEELFKLLATKVRLTKKAKLNSLWIEMLHYIHVLIAF